MFVSKKIAALAAVGFLSLACFGVRTASADHIEQVTVIKHRYVAPVYDTVPVTVMTPWGPRIVYQRVLVAPGHWEDYEVTVDKVVRDGDWN